MCGSFSGTPILRTIETCRSCGSRRLESILDLGEPYIIDFVDREGEAKRGRAPLELVLCRDCHLLQLRHTVNPELLYRQYYYRSSQNPIMVQNLRDVVAKVEALVEFEDGDLVIDIGSNDSSLLRMYPSNLIKGGFEPATNLLEEARKDTKYTFIINDYFSREKFLENFSSLYKAKVITSIAMFYDLDDPNKFVSDVAECLDENGVFIIEQRYLPFMLEQNDIGNVVHEHLTYYSMLSLKPLLERHGLEIFDVETNDVNGGSFRVYVKHKDAVHVCSTSMLRDGRLRVKEMEETERMVGLDTKEPYVKFVERVEVIREQTRNYLKTLEDQDKVIHVLGASTKGNYVLQYFGLDNKIIEVASDRDPRKWMKMMAGTWIPIVSEEASRKWVDVYLVLIWFYKKAIIEREKEFLKSGGKLIFPFPSFEVVSQETNRLCYGPEGTYP